MDLMEWITDERRRVADLLDGLTAGQLATPSLCAAWTVHDVAAHLLMPLVTPVPAVLLALARNGLSLDRANVALTAGVARRPAAELAAGLRERAGSRFRPPGAGFEAPLNDLLVHQQDIRRPLGLGSSLVPERLRVCLDFQATRRLTGPRTASALQGVRFEAADLGWSAGEGEPAEGSGEAVLMVLAGRPSAVADLRGPGADLLRRRPRD